MRKLYLSLLLTLTCHLLAGQSLSKKTTTDFSKLKWLIGPWTRTDSEAGQSGIESWQKISSHEFRGTGVTLNGKDTVFVEKLKIEIRNDTIFYISNVPENPKPVSFALTEITETGFVCENPRHDFPKKISYQRNGKSLKATISGDGKSIDYFFVRK